jgi:uncharacterized membrane protein
MSETHPVIDRYLTQLNESLSTLPAADRQEILHDIRGHFAEATAGKRSLESTLEALGPAEALGRAYTVELMLNPRRPMRSRAAYRLKIAGLIAAGSLPTLFVVILLGGVGGTLVLAGIVAILAGLVDAFGELPLWVQTSGMAPALVLSIGVAMMLVGLMGILTLRRFVRFVAATWRATLPKLVA